VSTDIGALTCGSFSMTSAGHNAWVIQCSRLPGWRQEIKANRETAARVISQLQAEYRNSWEVLPK